MITVDVSLSLWYGPKIRLITMCLTRSGQRNPKIIMCFPSTISTSMSMSDYDYLSYRLVRPNNWEKPTKINWNYDSHVIWLFGFYLIMLVFDKWEAGLSTTYNTYIRLGRPIVSLWASKLKGTSCSREPIMGHLSCVAKQGHNVICTVLFSSFCYEKKILQ